MKTDWQASRSVVEWAALECEQQRSGERSVLWMLDGWEYACEHSTGPITEAHIVALGGLVEPRHNNGVRYRTMNVQVGSSVKPHHTKVPELMTALVAALPKYADDPDEWFYEYESVHPFRDGNGRSGSVLWNWLRGTLPNPSAPPDFWNPQSPNWKRHAR